MPTVVLKLFVGQVSDGRTDKSATICFPLGEQNNQGHVLLKHLNNTLTTTTNTFLLDINK